MKLLYSNTSPYARKVRMVVLEKGLADTVDLVMANPFDYSPALKAANPLGKVPALILDDGSTLFDSPLMCEYLDAQGGNTMLIPEAAPLRWRVLRWQALADGLLDAAVSLVMESRRPSQEQSANWTSRWRASLDRSLDMMNAELATLPKEISLAQLALGAALGYLDFRLAQFDWRSGRETLADWYEAFAKQPSMVQTVPED